MKKEISHRDSVRASFATSDPSASPMKTLHAPLGAATIEVQV